MNDTQNSSLIGNLIKGIGATRIGGWLVLNVLTHIDPPLLRWTDGKFSISSLSGMPIAVVTTTGAKSGKERIVPLVCLADGDNRFVIASNTGKSRHPAWYHNMKAHPEVTIALPGADGIYIAREATRAERERLWQTACGVYPGYEIYKERAGDREIPIVVLEPKTD